MQSTEESCVCLSDLCFIIHIFSLGKVRRHELIKELRTPEPKDTEEEDYASFHKVRRCNFN